MKTVRIVALRQDRKRLLEHLQDSALVQIKRVEKSRSGFERVDMSRPMQVFERNVTLTEQALKILDSVSPEKGGMLASLKGRREVDPDEIGEIAAKSGEVISICNVFVGTFPEQYSEAALKEAIAAENPKLEFVTEIDHSEEAMTCAVIFVPQSQRTMAEDVLRTLGFARPMGATSKIPKVKSERLREKSERLRLENEMAEDEIKSLVPRRNNLDHSKHVFIIEGFVPEDDCEKLKELCERVATCTVDFEDAGDDAPVKLKNNKFAEPAQGILTMYSPPGKGDLDPTPLLAFFFYFFFGMMFSDAGYGLLMVIVIGIALKVFKPDKKMRNNLKLFQYCGISTTVWGLVFGSIFGDAPASLYNYFAGTTDMTMAKLLPWPTLDPQKDALLLMVISIAFGLVHILVGMGCKFVVCFREKDYAAAFFDTGLWMLLLIGLAVLAAGMFLAPVLVTVGAVIAIGCAVGLVLTQGRGKKGIVGKAIGGLASLYDVTSYISDLLSYSRLLALGLTTGVMAQVFNMLATMMGKSVVGFIFMVIIFIAGHLINIGLNALGSYVHTMRLQYVEMFSKFYEGGGKEFEPFSLQSKYIKIQEDNK